MWEVRYRDGPSGIETPEILKGKKNARNLMGTPEILKGTSEILKYIGTNLHYSE